MRKNSQMWNSLETTQEMVAKSWTDDARQKAAERTTKDFLFQIESPNISKYNCEPYMEYWTYDGVGCLLCKWSFVNKYEKLFMNTIDIDNNTVNIMQHKCDLHVTVFQVMCEYVLQISSPTISPFENEDVWRFSRSVGFIASATTWVPDRHTAPMWRFARGRDFLFVRQNLKSEPKSTQM